MQECKASPSTWSFRIESWRYRFDFRFPQTYRVPRSITPRSATAGQKISKRWVPGRHCHCFSGRLSAIRRSRHRRWCRRWSRLRPTGPALFSVSRHCRRRRRWSSRSWGSASRQARLCRASSFTPCSPIARHFLVGSRKSTERDDHAARHTPDARAKTKEETGVHARAHSDTAHKSNTRGSKRKRTPALGPRGVVYSTGTRARLRSRLQQRRRRHLSRDDIRIIRNLCAFELVFNDFTSITWFSLNF